MEIVRAKHAGFCFGVNNAVKKAFEKAENAGNKKIYTYGPLIHNGSVIKKLEEKGVYSVESVDEADLCGAEVIIRAHGVSPDVISALEEKGAIVTDATCPFVKKIQKLVREEFLAGHKIIIVGDRNHPEIIGVNGWCDNSAQIVDCLDDCKKIQDEGFTYSIVAQTTFNARKFAKIAEFFKNFFDKCIIFDTICNATSQRQQETVEIASSVDLMVVVGGRHSSNTVKLYEISRELCANVILVESAAEIDVSILEKIERVGVTAGASTPDWIIEEVICTMSEVDFKENDVIGDEVKAAAVAESDDDSFATLLEESFTTIATGEIVKKPIVKIDSSRVYVDLGFKFEGYIPVEEFSEVPGFDVGELNIGDMVEAIVVRVSDKDGEVLLSKRRVDYKKNIKILEESFENKTPVTVIVTEVIKGGVNAFLGTVKLFVPASQVSDRFVRDLSGYVGKPLEVIITSFERGMKGRLRIVGSAKAILEPIRKAKEDAFWGDIYEGKVCKGTVKNFAPFGAFVDIGGVCDGLIHNSELSWKKIRHPQDVLTIGQEVEVTVLSFDREKQSISFGYRKPEDNPWYDAENLYQVGDIVEVTVARFVSFGVFVNIADGIDGLVHISQISNRRISSAADCLKIGQKVMAKIIETNIPEHHINLSIRDVQAYDPEPKPEELDEEGNPIVKEKKERTRKNTERKAPKKAKEPEEEKFEDDTVSSASSIADIIGGAFTLDADAE